MRYIQKEKMKKIAIIAVVCFVVLCVILAIFYNKFKKNIYVITNNPKIELQINNCKNDKEIFEELIKLSSWMYDCQEKINDIYTYDSISDRFSSDYWLSNREYFSDEKDKIENKLETFALENARKLIEKSNINYKSQIIDSLYESDLSEIAIANEKYQLEDTKDLISYLERFADSSIKTNTFKIQIFYELDNEKIHKAISDYIKSFYNDESIVYERKDKICALISDIGQTELFAKEISDLEKYFEENNIKPKLSIYDTPFEELTSDQKLEIIRWIENRYEYYDNKEGRYCGDKYTKTIFQEAATKYNKTYAEIDAIHAQSYYLKY